MKFSKILFVLVAVFALIFTVKFWEMQRANAVAKTPYLFASLEERVRARRSPEVAKVELCELEKIKGLSPDQNPLVSFYVDKEGDYTVYYISKICVPGPGDNSKFLWIEKRVVKVSDEEMLEIRKECEGGE